MPEVWQSNIKQRYRWLYTESVRGKQGTTESHWHSVSKSWFITLLSGFSAAFLFMLHVTFHFFPLHDHMEHAWGGYKHRQRHTHAKGGPTTEQWNQTYKYCWDNAQLFPREAFHCTESKHTHTRLCLSLHDASSMCLTFCHNLVFLCVLV